MIKYRYNSYGKLIGKEKTEELIVTIYNPYIYKGYYYDEETGLYYCKTRYYSPEIGRFISPDDIEYLEPESINGLNLYVYCFNDPVNMYDPSGNFPVLALILSVTALAGLGLTIGGVASDNNILTAVGLTMVGYTCVNFWRNGDCSRYRRCNFDRYSWRSNDSSENR